MNLADEARDRYNSMQYIFWFRVPFTLCLRVVIERFNIKECSPLFAEQERDNSWENMFTCLKKDPVIRIDSAEKVQDCVR